MATERPNIHLTIAAYGALLLQFIVVICGGIVWWFVSSHQSRIEYELGELRKEQTIVSTDLANEDLKYRRTTVVGLNCTILPTQLAHGIQQLDLVVNMRNEGLAALKIGELEVVVERGVPDAHVREALERASPELPPSTVPAEWKPALDPYSASWFRCKAQPAVRGQKRFELEETSRHGVNLAKPPRSGKLTFCKNIK